MLKTYYEVHGGFYFNTPRFKTEKEAFEAAIRLSNDSWSDDIVVTKTETVLFIPKKRDSDVR